MKKIMCFFILLVSGCSQVSHENSRLNARPADSDYANINMAHDNYINAEANESKLLQIYNDIYGSCIKTPNECIVLSTNFNKNDTQTIDIKIQAEKTIITDFISKVQGEALVISQSTSSENISNKIAESNRKLKFLINYQKQLEQLKNAAEKNIDSMLKLAKELAENQAKIDELNNDNLKNNQNLQMQTLSVNLSSSQGFASPILKSLSKFKSNLSDGISGTITFIAFLLPALILIFLIILFVKKVKSFYAKQKNT